MRVDRAIARSSTVTTITVAYIAAACTYPATYIAMACTTTSCAAIAALLFIASLLIIAALLSIALLLPTIGTTACIRVATLLPTIVPTTLLLQQLLPLICGRPRIARLALSTIACPAMLGADQLERVRVLTWFVEQVIVKVIDSAWVRPFLIAIVLLMK
jgi:hypothetical protein